MDPLVSRAFDLLTTYGRFEPDFVDFTWFSLGETPLELVGEANIDPKYLPFPKLATVFSVGEKRKRMVMLAVLELEKIYCEIIVLGATIAPLGFPIEVALREDLKLLVTAHDKKLGEDARESIAAVVVSVLVAINKATSATPCSFLSPALHPLAHKRIAQGRKPTYEWKTITIEPARARAEAEPSAPTGSHKKQHPVRGHWCTVRKTGTKYWRKDCKRGNPALGTIFHDYVVKPTS